MKAFKRDIAHWNRLPRTRKLLILLAIAILFFTGFLAGMYIYAL